MAREKIEKPPENIEKLRDELISKGGHVQADNEKILDKKAWVNFCLRIRMDMLAEIDEDLEERIGLSKTGWILEAVQEKLKRRKANE